MFQEKFNWEETLNYVNSLDDNHAKIKYLLEQKTKHQQENDWDLSNFERNCQFEIDKLKEFIALEKESPYTEKKAKQHSNSQMVLIFYYFFKQCGIEPRLDVDIAPIAKFIHLITNKEFTKTQNSDFYKKLQRAPNFKSDKGLINDLESIKPLFEKVQLNEVVKLIEQEINVARSEIKQNNP